jgi:hypothetical protein
VRYGRLTLLACMFLGNACTRPPVHYELNRQPTNGITIVGTVPPNMGVEMTAVWQVTVLNDVCAPYQPQPAHERIRAIANLPVTLKARAGDQMTWTTWRDLLTPGKCGWRLIGLDFKADRSREALDRDKEHLAPSRIAFVCVDRATCPGNTRRMNDDPEELVRQYCKFSVVGMGTGASNPCIFGPDSHFAGPEAIAFKEQHNLRPEQHTVRFALVDLESAERQVRDAEPSGEPGR